MEKIFDNANVLQELLIQHGRFHDAEVVSVEFFIPKKTLIVKIDNINAAFADLPEYNGCEPGLIVMLGVERVSVEIDPITNHHVIYAVEAKGEKGVYSSIGVTIMLSPGGRMCVTCKGGKLQGV